MTSSASGREEMHVVCVPFANSEGGCCKVRRVCCCVSFGSLTVHKTRSVPVGSRNLKGLRAEGVLSASEWSYITCTYLILLYLFNLALF